MWLQLCMVVLLRYCARAGSRLQVIDRLGVHLERLVCSCLVAMLLKINFARYVRAHELVRPAGRPPTLLLLLVIAVSLSSNSSSSSRRRLIAQ